MLCIKSLLLENRQQPIGVDTPVPRLSWVLESDRKNVVQTAYTICIKNSEDKILFSSGKTESGESLYIPIPGIEWKPCTRYRTEVTVWDNQGQRAEGSTYFETGLLSPASSFSKARWLEDPRKDPKSLPVFTKQFHIANTAASARLYITAHGIYEAELDGEKIGSAWFAPGWTSYHKRLQYQTLPMVLSPGDHTLSVTVGNGWYKGALGFMPTPNHYGDRTGVLAMLRIEKPDGSVQWIPTDDSWRVTDGCVREAEFYYGETYDARAVPGAPAVPKLASYPLTNLVAQEDEPVQCINRLPPISSFVTPQGEWVLDFGQNLTGVVEARLNLPAGGKIKLRHGESLDENGNFYTGNLSFARSEDTYISSGTPQTYTPRFTYHGFRYLCIEGMPEGLRDPGAFTACALSTAMPRTGSFLCSHARLNQLQSNIQWSQSDNFLEIPTDCPQRSERLGWTGDIRAYAKTALFNSDASSFLAKWLRDLAADQGESGAVPYVVPNILDAPGGPVATASFWGDAATVVPWETYMARGDREILSRQYPSMKAWVDYMEAQCSESGLWQSGFQYGDWLGLDAERSGLVDERVGATDVYFLANISYADSVRIVSETAHILGYTEDAERYAALHRRIVSAFRKEYLTGTGRMVSESQTALTMALEFGMVPEEHRGAVSRKLADSITAHKNHIITGFVGTPFVCDALSNHGYHALAGKVVLQEENPSWLYEVNMGATTIWERWDSILPDHSFNPANMNSLNHYAYGSIGSWLYRRLGGIEAAAPGYRKIRLRPQPIQGISWVQCSLESPYGLIRCDWRVENGTLHMEVEIPVGATAEVTLPGENRTEILGSGSYIWNLPTVLNLTQARYTMETQVKTVFASPVAQDILRQYAPDFLENPMMEYVMDSTLNEMLAYSAEAKPLFESILRAMNEKEK